MLIKAERQRLIEDWRETEEFEAVGGEQKKKKCCVVLEMAVEREKTFLCCSSFAQSFNLYAHQWLQSSLTYLTHSTEMTFLIIYVDVVIIFLIIRIIIQLAPPKIPLLATNR